MPIKPTVGRVVHFHRYYVPREHRGYGYQPLAAIITYVHHDGLVNLVVFDIFGCPEGMTSVHLCQDDDAAPMGPYAEWMPYQKDVAAGKIAPTLHATSEQDHEKKDTPVVVGRWLPGEREGDKA